MIREEVVRRKRSSGFASALGFFLFLFLLISFGFLGAVYIYRDKLILEYVRDLGPKALGFEALAIDSLLTRPIGQISLEMRGVVFKSSPKAPLLRAERVLISTPKNLLSLYQLTFSRQTLPLKLQLTGLQVQALPNEPNSSSAATGNETAFSNQRPGLFKLPFPIDLETEFRDAQILIGHAEKPFTVRNLTGLAKSSISTSSNGAALIIKSSGQLSMGVGLGPKNFLPLRTEWTLQAEPQLAKASDFLIQITSLTVSTLGMKLKSSGSLKWPEQSFSINMAGSTPDLGVLPLEPAESAALGLSGRLKGSADLDIMTSGTLGQVVTSRGLLRVRQGVFPFDITSTSEQPISIKGPVAIDIEAPFDFAFDMKSNALTNLKLQAAKFDIDLTNANVGIDGILKKPEALMMALKTEFNAAGDTIDVSRGEFRLANFLLQAIGKISMDPRRNSKIEVTATLPSLGGWPRLLPLLGPATKEGAPSERIDAAKGSFALKASADIPLSQPSRMKTASKFVFELLEVNGIEVPINTFKSSAAKDPVDSIRAEGILRGNFSATGTIQLTDKVATPWLWKLHRAKGFFDLNDLAVDWKDRFEKKRSQTASMEFAVLGIETTENPGSTRQIQIDRLDLKLSDSTVFVKGSVRELGLAPSTSPKVSSYGIDAKILSRLALSQIYETLPLLRPFRSQVPTGTMTANLGIKGTLKSEPNSNPLATSPLAVIGTIGLIAPRAIVLVPAPKTRSDATPAGPSGTAITESSFFKWPIFKLANVNSDIQIASIALTTSEAKGFKSRTRLAGGRLGGSVTVASLFGGSILVDSFSAQLDSMAASAAGSYRGLDLSLFGEYFDPKWKSAIGGRSTGRFKLSKAGSTDTSAPLSIADSVSVSGDMTVKNGFFSTASIDQMVNRKLAENPQIAKLLGAPRKIETGGARVDMSTSYSYAKSILTLRRLVMKSPENNEVSLDGWIKTDLTVDLKGKAFLKDTPIGGSFRQANSDASGRLVVPIHLTGRMNEPSLSMAQDIVSTMIGKTIQYETEKARKEVGKEAGKIIDKKKNEVIDAVKEELKKRGLSF